MKQDAVVGVCTMRVETSVVLVFVLREELAHGMLIYDREEGIESRYS